MMRILIRAAHIVAVILFALGAFMLLSVLMGLGGSDDSITLAKVLFVLGALLFFGTRLVESRMGN